MEMPNQIHIFFSLLFHSLVSRDNLIQIHVRNDENIMLIWIENFQSKIDNHIFLCTHRHKAIEMCEIDLAEIVMIFPHFLCIVTIDYVF